MQQTSAVFMTVLIPLAFVGIGTFTDGAVDLPRSDAPTETHAAAIIDSERASLADLPFASGPGPSAPTCGWCAPTYCHAQQADGHIAGSENEGSQDVSSGTHPSLCVASDCNDMHPMTCTCLCSTAPDPEACMQACGPPGGGGELARYDDDRGPVRGILATKDLPLVWAAVRSGDVEPEEVLKAYINVEFNASRSALQVIGCGDLVIAHLPLPSSP
jgi:hypothetical protein